MPPRLIFLGLDLLWLRVMPGASAEVRSAVSCAISPTLPPPGPFYLPVSAALSCSWSARRCRAVVGDRVILGSRLGVIAYGTYDMTNLATLRGWPVALSAVDLV